MKKNVRSLGRQERIVQLLAEGQTVSVAELAAGLNVSGWTVRRDLSALEARGLLERRYGEAQLRASYRASYRPPTDPAADGADAQAAKRRVGGAAARLVGSGQHVALSAGTTTREVARALRERGTACFVVTNALNIASELAPARSVRVTCTGGEVDGDYNTLNGPVAERALRGHFFDLAIVGVSGLEADAGLTVDSQLNALALETMIRHAKRVVVVADRSKFGAVRFAHLAPLDVLDILVTDERPAGALAERLAAHGVEVVVAAAAP